MEPLDGASDSLESDSTYPSDTGAFRVRRPRSRLGFGLAGVALLLGGLAVYFDHAQSRKPPLAPSKTAKARAEQDSRQEAVAAAERQRCLETKQRVLAEPSAPGTPTLDANRIELMLRTKLEPVVFVRPPQFDDDVPTSTKGLRRSFSTTRYPSSLLNTLTRAFRVHPLTGRRTLLRDGYLYAEDPERAFALVQHVRAEHLYDDERIWIQRGDQVLHAERTKSGSYRYLDGTLQGKEVSLVLFDRIGTGSVPEAVHRDLRSVQYRLHFDRLELVHVTRDHVVADLKYGGLTIPTVLKSSGARLELECEVVPPGASRDLGLYRRRGEQKQSVIQALRRAMRAQIEEQLPFDEPYHEWGQQDGVLRYKWRDAYLRGKRRFELNDDTYYVYGPDGQPKIPQVCIDFLTDTLERASGTWWSRLGEEPQRIVGKLDFNTLENATLRRASDFVQLAHDRPEWFDAYDVPPERQIPFWQRKAFTNYLLKNVDRFVPGDIVLIRGYTNFEKKWERPIMHYHSFFIYERDPVTGLPIAIVGNAGVPSLRVWDTEARRTPRRAIWHRLRPHLHWLSNVIETPAEPDTQPAPLALGRD